MSIKKYTDWRTWWDGLRTNLIKCIGTTGVAWMGTNAAAGSGVPIKGIDWEQAATMFGVHVAFELFMYARDNQPKVIVEESNTEFKTKSATGDITEGSRSTKTTTPIQPNENNPPQS